MFGVANGIGKLPWDGTMCCVCLHEKVCQHKETYRKLAQEVERHRMISNETQNTLFTVTVQCNEHYQTPSIIRNGNIRTPATVITGMETLYKGE